MAAPTPPSDQGFRTSLLRHLGGALAVVVLAAGLFGAVGQLRAEPDVQISADGDAPAEATGPPAEAEPAPSDTTSETETEAEPNETATAPEDPMADGTSADDEEAEDEVEEQDPSEISVQVLDGVGDGETADRVAQQLRDEGFDVIVINPASVEYEATTAFWTSGNEDAARQVAETMGYTEVDAQPGMLSEEVDVHVVAGTDQR